MNRNYFWRVVLIVGIVLWSLYEMYPPTNRDLIQVFRQRAVKHDEEFAKILARAQELQKLRPDLAYENLQEAVDTNDITRYFPFFEAQNEVHPTTAILNQLQREAAGKIKLGLDLQGGVAITVQLTNRPAAAEGETNRPAAAEITPAALQQAVEVLRKRVDRFGVAEPVIQPEGTDRIRIQLPGLSHAQMETAKDTIQKVAFLEFKLVHPDSEKLTKENLPIPPGYQVMVHTKTLPNGRQESHKFVVKTKSEMVGGIKQAFVTRDNMGDWEIDFQFESGKAEEFARITRKYVHRQLAIILDGELQSAPEIQNPIENGNGRITGDFTEQEAFTLRNVLENPLQTPVQIVSSSEVDPTLGKDSISSGIKASIYGIIAVSVFMLAYYLVAGLVANAALMLNIVILLGVMCSIGTTLTLPGIAGVVLTIGMAVDANVLIYERIREELATGKSMRGALDGRLWHGLRHHFRFERDHADFVGHFDFHGHGPCERFRRHADHRRDGQHVHGAGGDAVDLRLVAGQEHPEEPPHDAHYPGFQNRFHEMGHPGVYRVVAADRHRQWLRHLRPRPRRPGRGVCRWPDHDSELRPGSQGGSGQIAPGGDGSHSRGRFAFLSARCVQRQGQPARHHPRLRALGGTKQRRGHDRPGIAEGLSGLALYRGGPGHGRSDRRPGNPANGHPRLPAGHARHPHLRRLPL